MQPGCSFDKINLRCIAIEQVDPDDVCRQCRCREVSDWRAVACGTGLDSEHRFAACNDCVGRAKPYAAVDKTTMPQRQRRSRSGVWWPCLLGVRGGSRARSQVRPNFSDKQTFARRSGTSEKCHKPTFGLALRLIRGRPDRSPLGRLRSSNRCSQNSARPLIPQCRFRRLERFSEDSSGRNPDMSGR
jgi:hypothetical protein